MKTMMGGVGERRFGTKGGKILFPDLMDILQRVETLLSMLTY